MIKEFQVLFVAALAPLVAAAQTADPQATAGKSLNVLVRGASKFTKPISDIGRVEFSLDESGDVVAKAVDSDADADEAPASATGTLKVVGKGKDPQTLHQSSLAGASLTFGEAMPPTSLRRAPLGDAAPLGAWPNPTRGAVTLSGVTDGQAVVVRDLGGRAVLHGSAPSVDLSGLPAGVYVVSAGGRSVRIIKQ